MIMRFTLLITLLIFGLSCTKDHENLPSPLWHVLNGFSCSEGCKSFFQRVELTGQQNYYYLSFEGGLCDPNPNRSYYYHSDGTIVEKDSELFGQLVKNGVKADRKWRCKSQN